MNNPSEVKDPDDLAPEELQEKADIKREELAETPPPDGDPKAFDVIGSEQPSKEPNDEVSDEVSDEIVGDIKSLSLNEKYALILHQVKQLGPLFFVQVNPDTFKLPDRDPLNLIWINILTGWGVASIILSQFEQNIVVTEQLEREADEDDIRNNKGTAESSTESSE